VTVASQMIRKKTDCRVDSARKDERIKVDLFIPANTED
jgi:hypothetical protein